jgi:hypothetical protein
MALYRSPVDAEDKACRAPGRAAGPAAARRQLAGRRGRHLQHHRGPTATPARGGFIPYTNRAIRWHTDGYYHPAERRIRGMVLHCVRPAASGGVNRCSTRSWPTSRCATPPGAGARADAARRDDHPGPRDDDDGVARAAQAGPVFSVDAGQPAHALHGAHAQHRMGADAATCSAVAASEALLDGPSAPAHLRVRLEPGMGLVSHNVLHDRSAFVDDPAQPAPAVPRALPRPRVAAWPGVREPHGAVGHRLARGPPGGRAARHAAAAVRAGELRRWPTAWCPPNRCCACTRRPSSKTAACSNAWCRSATRPSAAPARAPAAQPGGAGAAPVPPEPGTGRHCSATCSATTRWCCAARRPAGAVARGARDPGCSHCNTS